MPRVDALTRNVLLYRLIILFGGNGLTTSAIYFFFTLNKGFSPTQALSLVGLALLAIALTEVPTGVIADKFSRKYAIVIGHAILLFSWIGILVAPSYWLILLFTLGKGIGGSFISGADEALLYDSLKESGQSEKFKSIYNTSQSIMLVSFAITVLIGGIIADINLFLPVIGHIILIALSMVFATLLTEPITTKKGEMLEQSGYLPHLKSSSSQIFSKKSLSTGLLGAFVSLALVVAVFK